MDGHNRAAAFSDVETGSSLRVRGDGAPGNRRNLEIDLLSGDQRFADLAQTVA
jgi:hypothetical protein